MPFYGTKKANSCFSDGQKILTAIQENGIFRVESWAVENFLKMQLFGRSGRKPDFNCARKIADMHLELPAKKSLPYIYGGYIIADVKLSYEHVEHAWSSLENILEMDALPEHFKEFFKRFAAENKEPPELPI